MREYTKHVENVTNITNKNAQTVNQTFNITMPNVTDATKAEEMMRDLQSLGRKKYQIDWNK